MKAIGSILSLDSLRSYGAVACRTARRSTFLSRSIPAVRPGLKRRPPPPSQWSDSPSSERGLPPFSREGGDAEFPSDEHPTTRARQKSFSCKRAKNRRARQRLQPEQSLGLRRGQPEARHFTVFLANSLHPFIKRRLREHRERRQAHQQSLSGEQEPYGGRSRKPGQHPGEGWQSQQSVGFIWYTFPAEEASCPMRLLVPRHDRTPSSRWHIQASVARTGVKRIRSSAPSPGNT
jgi:hypothetical protein